MMNLSKSQGKLIVIEGPEGSGKTHVTKSLAKYLSDIGLSVVASREPGGVEVAEKIRQILVHDKMHPITEAYLFLAARAEHLQKIIKPALAEGKIVILDRFLHSTLAMQGTARGLDVNELRRIHKLPLDGIVPDYTFFLDVPPKVGLARKAAQGGDEIAKFELEEMTFHEGVYKGYKELADNNEMIRIDAHNQSLEEVVENIINYIKLGGFVHDTKKTF